MAGTLRQAMVFLGLADDGYEQPAAAPQKQRSQGRESGASRYDEVDTYDAGPEEIEFGEEETEYVTERPNRHRSRRSHAVAALEPASRYEEDAEDQESEEDSDYRAPVTPIHRASAPIESDNELRRITTIHPRSYNDAKVIGESFRDNIPVIMNVTDMEVAEAKRLVDFSSGLTFALNGSIERVTEQVFLLTPANLEVIGSNDLSGVNQAPDEDSVFNQN